MNNTNTRVSTPDALSPEKGLFSLSDLGCLKEATSVIIPCISMGINNMMQIFANAYATNIVEADSEKRSAATPEIIKKSDVGTLMV